MGAGYSQSDTVQRRDWEVMRLIGPGCRRQISINRFIMPLTPSTVQCAQPWNRCEAVPPIHPTFTSSRRTGYAETLRGLGLHHRVTEGSRLCPPDAFVVCVVECPTALQPCAVHVLYSAHSTTGRAGSVIRIRKSHVLGTWHSYPCSVTSAGTRLGLGVLEECRLG